MFLIFNTMVFNIMNVTSDTSMNDDSHVKSGHEYTKKCL
jgi:hypothetical protein